MKNQNTDWLNHIRQERLKGASRNPGTAALMSFFLMGMGQIYAGHIDRGIILLFLHLGGIFAAISIYTGGLLYNAVFPLIGAHLMIICCYVLSVIYILLWIYNIKDAYYLTLFSSFRDWFEVERVLIPILQQSPEALIAGPEQYESLPAFDSSADEGVSLEATEEADVFEVKMPLSQPSDEKKATINKVKTENSETVITPEGLGALKISGQSWKIYTGLAAIFLLLGIWIDNHSRPKLEESFDDLTHFGVSVNLGPDSEKNNRVTTEVKVSAGSALENESAGDSKPVPFFKGLELAAANKFTDAVESFEKDFSLAEPSQAQWKAILNAYYRSDSTMMYEARLRQYLNSFGEDAQTWFRLGKLLYDRNDLAQAAQAIANGLKSNPADLRGNYLLGSLYLDLKLYGDAIPHLQKIVELEPLNPEFNRSLARAFSATGKNDEAGRYFQRVLSLLPDDREARTAVNAAKSGVALVSISDEDEDSVVVIQGKTDARIIEKNRELDIPAAETGKVLYEAPIQKTDPVTEKTPVAVSPVKDNLVEKVVNTPPAIVKAETSVDKIKEKKTGLRSADGISELEASSGKSAESVRNTASAEVSADDAMKNAIAHEIDTDTDELKELNRKGSAEFLRGNWETALESYLKVLQKKKSAETFETVSIIFEKLNSPKEAFAAVEHAYQLGKRDSNSLVRLGRLAHTVGDNAKGEFYLYHALQKMPHRIDLRILYAGCLHANGKSKVAEAELKRVIDASKNSYAVRRRAELELQKIKTGK